MGPLRSGVGYTLGPDKTAASKRRQFAINLLKKRCQLLFAPSFELIAPHRLILLFGCCLRLGEQAF